MCTKPIYTGFAKVHLEGAGALIPHRGYSRKQVKYSIGSEASQFEIIDKRVNVNSMAVSAIDNQGHNWSPELFCSPCFINICQEDDRMVVEMQERSTEKNYEYPILWTGVFDGEELQANPVGFLQFADLGDGRTAFIGLVDPAYE